MHNTEATRRIYALAEKIMPKHAMPRGSRGKYNLSEQAIQMLAAEITNQLLMVEKTVWSDKEMALYIGRPGVHRITLLRWAKRYGALRTSTGRWNASSIKLALKRESMDSRKVTSNV